VLTLHQSTETTVFPYLGMGYHTQKPRYETQVPELSGASIYKTRKLFGAERRVNSKDASGDVPMSTKDKKRNKRLLNLGPGKTVLLPDIYGEESTPETSGIEPVEEELPREEEDDSHGFDPYDTARLYKK
jgi:hypothetical protein